MDQSKLKELRRLITKLETLELLDRQVDVDICHVLEYVGGGHNGLVTYIRKEGFRLIYHTYGSSAAWEYIAPELTESIDAVKHLFFTIAHGEAISVLGSDLKKDWHSKITLTVQILGNVQVKSIEFKGKTEPAARLGAILRYVIQKAAMKEHLRQQ